MTLSKTFSAALLAAALVAPGAVRADDPGVFKVPGTDSTIKFYGYVQLDTTVDFSARADDIENNDWASVLPAVPADGTKAAKKSPQVYMTARTSRFGIMTNTPSAMGNVGVRLEGDFNAPNGFQSETFTNSVLFRLRHAYGTVGGLLVGQTWSTFLDLGAAPDTVDFNGPGSLALVRNPMIRYTASVGGGSLALALENTRGAQFGGETRFQVMPDAHANYTLGGSWGHLSLRAVGQQYNRVYQPSTNAVNKSAYSVSGAVSGSVKLGADTLVAQFAGGPGIGRYMLNSFGAPWWQFDNTGAIKFWSSYGVHAGLTHVWNPSYRSNIIGSYTWTADAKVNGAVAGTGVQKEQTQVFANTFWSASKTTEFGVEYAYGQWKSFGNTAEKGTQNRVNASFHYNFF